MGRSFQTEHLHGSEKLTKDESDMVGSVSGFKVQIFPYRRLSPVDSSTLHSHQPNDPFSHRIVGGINIEGGKYVLTIVFSFGR